MRYPHCIFFRYDKYSYIDNFLLEFQKEYHFTLGVTSNKFDLNKLFSSNYHLLITYGDTKQEYESDIFSILPETFENYWVHYTDFTNFKKLNKQLNKKYTKNLLNREIYQPIFSIFTTCYNSYEKILRAYESIKLQTLFHWEWVVLDDSPDDKHFHFLREHFLCDSKIRFYRKGENNGNIGNVKNEAVSLCRGKYVLELDHDDEIVSDLLQNAADIFDKDSEVGFIYTDFINIYENGNNFKYEGCICKGYGGYYMQKHKDKWVNVYITPNINNITLSYLICCPNHARIWRKDLLLNLGNYCEQLYICDDYEIILRTAILTKKKIVKLNKLGYIQYMNDNGNNFSLIRNEEINRIGPEYISPIFYKKYKVHNIMEEKGGYEDPKYIHYHSNIWEREPNYQHKFSNEIINLDYDRQYCILGIETLIINKDNYHELYKDSRNDFILLDNKVHIEKIIIKIENLGFNKMKCYSLLNNSRDQMVNYFNMLCRYCNSIDIMCDAQNNYHFPKRSDIINQFINYETAYLEIGIEYGETFKYINTENKIGVDPDPKFEDYRISKKKSNTFFRKNKNYYDIIFIDGMHQVEYVINDINNSISFLKSNGKIFIDDILPFTYSEQLKIPNKHVYENGILKYGEPWTGDVWKVIFYILKHYLENIASQAKKE
jgi:glycosyltransferase involved in cell wall biosynthesis